MASRVAHTTMASQNTAADGSGQTGLGIRWVFPTSRGLLTRLAGERSLLGRDDECQVQLLGKETSRRHAEIRRDGPVYILKDLVARRSDGSARVGAGQIPARA
jgi:pSer/pThr/pTyr-binding forkhead associated (FHA) protein